MPTRTYKAPRRKSKLPKPRLWAKSRAVQEFSWFIRKRDGMCLYPSCGATERLQNSHYIGRARNATTFDPDNCITLCERHHYGDKLLGFEYQKQVKELHGYDGQYTLFMKRHLGPNKFKELVERGRNSVPITRVIIGVMTLLNAL